MNVAEWREEMRNENYSRAIAAWMLAVTPLISTTAMAEGMDGSRDIVCAVSDIVGCADSGACVEGSAKDFELPQFMILDADKKVVRASYESGQKAVSPVKNLERSQNHLLLQGVENGRGWNIAIDTRSGNMSASAVGEAVSFLAFGACTVL
jgi:hypothetical protein